MVLESGMDTQDHSTKNFCDLVNGESIQMNISRMTNSLLMVNAEIHVSSFSDS